MSENEQAPWQITDTFEHGFVVVKASRGHAVMRRVHEGYKMVLDGFDTREKACNYARHLEDRESNPEKYKVQDFLAELSDLSRKYGITIGGCGCCGSPWLDTDYGALCPPPEDGGYKVDDGFGSLRWSNKDANPDQAPDRRDTTGPETDRTPGR